MAQFKELENANGEIGREGIKKIIPYDDPFLFVDRILRISKDRLTALKHVNINEPYLKGHFVGFPIMPGALIVEGLGQAATFLARSNLQNHQEKDVLAYKLKEVKFMHPILPGDEVKYEIEMIAMDEKGAVCKGQAFVKDIICAEAFFVIAIVNRAEFRAKYSR